MSRVIGPAILLLLSIAFYWRLVLTNQYTWLDSPDLANMVAPRFQFMAAEWHHLRFPLWDPYQWCGQPFLGQWTGAAMPLNWPLFVFGGFDQGKLRFDLMNWYFVLCHWLGAVFCYWLCRDVGRSRGASILAGCIFSFGGYFGSTDWPEVFTGILWTPLAFLFLLRSRRGERPVASAALAGLFCGISWLSGHHQAPYYLTLAVSATWLGLAVADGRLRPLRDAAITIVFAVFGGAMQLLPGHEYGKLAYRWAGTKEPLTWADSIPYDVHMRYALQAPDLFGIVLQGYGGHVSLLIGAAAAVLVVRGVVAHWGDVAVRVMTLVAVGGLLFSMAEWNVFYGALYALVPGFEKARVPARTTMLFGFAVGPLAAFGLDSLRERVPRRLIHGVLAAGAASACVALALGAVGKGDQIARFSAVGFALVAAAGVLASGSRWIPAGMIALAMIEMNQARVLLPILEPSPDSPLKRLSAHRDLEIFLKGQPGPHRVEYADEIGYNFGQWRLIEAIGGFGAGFTVNMHEMDWPGEKTRDLLGVTYTIAKKPTRRGQEEVFSGQDGWKIFRNPGAFPRAWIVREARAAKDRKAVREGVVDPAADLRRVAFVMGDPPKLDGCGDAGSVRWLDRKAGRIRLEASSGCRGMLVVADTWYPGWKARVDGASEPVLEVDGGLRGVVLGPGKHMIEMYFAPWSFYVGTAMTVSAVVAALLLWFRLRW